MSGQIEIYDVHGVYRESWRQLQRLQRARSTPRFQRTDHRTWSYIGLECKILSFSSSLLFSFPFSKCSNRTCSSRTLNILPISKSIVFILYPRAQSQSFLSCLKTNLESCVRPHSNSLLLEALGLVVLQSLPGTEVLCESPIKQIVWGNLPPLLQTVASCSQDYTNEVIHCGRRFRSRFIPVPSPLCEEFENARTCVDEARKSFCLFDIQSRMTLKGNFNPFCDNRTKPLFMDAGDRLQVNFKLEICLLLSLAFSNFT